MSKIRWPLVGTLSMSGVVYAWLTILAWIHGHEHWVALIIVISIAIIAVFLEQRAPVRLAFVAGYGTALLALWTQALFAPLYLQNNPAYASIDVPFGLSMVSYTLAFSPVGGLIAGCLAALIAWPLSQIAKRWR